MLSLAQYSSPSSGQSSVDMRLHCPIVVVVNRSWWVIYEKDRTGLFPVHILCQVHISPAVVNSA